MYIPKYFNQNDVDKTIAFINENEFAVLNTLVNSKIEAVHLPFILKVENDKWILEAHLSAHNAIAHAINNEEKALVVFQGPHAYVSSSWYGQINVPTWNYEAVHCYGKLQKLNAEETDKLMRFTMNKYESTQQQGMKYEELPEKLKSNLLKEIVAFKIEVEDVQAKSKLSQNRNEKDFNSVIHHLEKGNEQAKQIAEAMKKLKA